ncbi:phragmoplast orienting kinesin-1-like [Pyrus ussuriensis x Pyrus communis]|uniref:Phragmoplast orienting kinesin-1-like n=1 Tax=Pyrus ussuriensis x Pyrus communis TaxID=2448454 RepID=A0A5N5FU16_9ROSA|nr:phragmoplast orienting kinesin-1-like [Pyrus ussuriensis x Pyrus communis]
MPFLSDTASAIKTRFGFHDHSSDPVRSTPSLHKSASKESFSALRSIGDWDDDDDDGKASAATTSSNQSFEFHEDPSFWKDHNVQVIIRVRPLNSAEVSVQGYGKCVRQESCQTITWTGHPESRFTFDIVADENVSQEQLFKVAGLPMVDNCMIGYNSCMFAYGQTGSGKTHTMLGDIEGGTRRHSANCGMTPRVFEYLFSRIQKEKEGGRDEKLKFICKCSFLEIYNEQILDLLDPSSNNLQIREDIKKGVYVENLKEVEVTSARDVIQQLIQGAANRKVAATNMNHASSRSHSVFTCIIESKRECQGVAHHRFARLNLVDLAGSERQKSSGAEGERLKEATNINKSLSTLGLVIMNLVNMSNGKSLHVPYRDSKLTFLLQDSLGGNSKTTIIANISPASCCSLETLSTLKFAQRAKFIKNNAIVNEDASGDVIAMRVQIQQLKKEVSHLRGLVNGGTGNQDNDMLAVSFPGSPGSFKWEGPNGSFSPFTSGKRTSQKKDYEVALVGAFRREKDKDIALQTLAAESQAALQLAKQREDEIQGLKMRLRFREAGIKRLEAVACGKISAETHLLKEKEEYLKEIEVLRAQVDRNQEVTRFAMENLRLKEEIRRLKSFYEEGERDIMNEQIMVLQNKLLEALDWKLMHESEPSTDTNQDVVMEGQNDDNMLISNQEQASPWQSSIKEENEFLRMQAIHNQSEMDTLQKKLDLCLEEKETLERGDFRTSYRNTNKSECAHDGTKRHSNGGGFVELAKEKEAEMNKVVENLEHQLADLHEENEKLMGLYERAMQEGDELKRVLASGGQEKVKAKGEFDSLKKLVDVLASDGGASPMSLEGKNFIGDNSLSGSDGGPVPVEEFGLCGSNVQTGFSHISDEVKADIEESGGSKSVLDMAGLCTVNTEGGSGNEADVGIASDMELDMSDLTAVKLSEDLNLARMNLERADEQLLDSAKTVAVFGCMEKLILEVGKLSREIEATKGEIQVKQQLFESYELLSEKLKENCTLIDKKLSALKYSLSSFSSSVVYFEQREARARARVAASTSYLDQKNGELVFLQTQKDEIAAEQMKMQQSEVELKKSLACLKSKLDDENKKQENEQVLFAIDNVDKIDPSQKNWHLGGKATELLKSAEEKTKLQTEMKLCRENIGVTRRELEDLNRKFGKVDSELVAVQVEMQKAVKSVGEMEVALENVMKEKEMLLEVSDNGITEIESLVIEYQQHLFESELKEAESKILEEDLQTELRKLEKLRKERVLAAGKTMQLLDTRSHPCLLSEKMEEELQSVRKYVVEAKSLLLGEANSTVS